jgi:hypothetical protein
MASWKPGTIVAVTLGGALAPIDFISGFKSTRPGAFITVPGAPFGLPHDEYSERFTFITSYYAVPKEG